MGFFTYLLGWRKLIDFTIAFGDDNKVAVSSRSDIVTMPGFEYIRMWLEYVAQVIYLLEQVGPQYSSTLMDILVKIGNENLDSGADIFAVLYMDENVNYANELQNVRSVVKGKYYVRGSMYRMINASIVKPETMIYAVLALFQYVLNKNSEDQKSLKILSHSAKAFVELYRSGMNKSVNTITQIPAMAYMGAVAETHVK